MTDKHTLLGPESFMNAVAATHDRQEFDRLTLPPKQPQQTSPLQKARHENSWCSKGASYAGNRPLAEGSPPSQRRRCAPDNVFSMSSAPAPALARARVSRHTYENIRVCASSSTGDTAGLSFDTSPRSPTSQQTKYQPSKLTSADIEELFPEAGKYLHSDSYAFRKSTERPLNVKRTAAVSAVSAGHTSWTTIASLKHSASAEHEWAAPNVDGHVPGIFAKAVGPTAVISNAPTHDISTSKPLQPVQGGGHFVGAQKAALRMQRLLLPEPQSFGHPAINAVHVHYATHSFLYQAGKATCSDTSTRTQADCDGKISPTVDAIDASKNGCSMETKPAKSIYEDDKTAPPAWQGGTVEQKFTPKDATEKGIAEEGTKEATVDPFKWLLPANF